LIPAIKHTYHVYKNSCDIVFQFEQILFRGFAFFLKNLHPGTCPKVLAKKVSEKYDVSIGELRSGGRRRAVVQARRAMSWIGVMDSVIPGLMLRDILMLRTLA
jgi:hypothetical protein